MKNYTQTNFNAIFVTCVENLFSWKPNKYSYYIHEQWKYYDLEFGLL